MRHKTEDRLKRPLRDLRISVTDRCNFRCVYCMPKEVFGSNFQFMPSSQLLTFEEISRLAQTFLMHGVEKIRITGGEPLVRRNVEKLIAMLAGLDGLHDLTLTTNGSLLSKKAQALKDAGLRRITVSLDAVDDAIFKAMNDVDYPVSRVIEGLETARRVGLRPIKINMVVKRGMNDNTIIDMARFARSTGDVVRFIEYMDVGNTNGWRLDQVVPAAEVVAKINAEFPLEPIEPNYLGEVARRYRYKDGGGEIGVIASVTQPFCNSCTRARLSSEGILYTCLFATQGYDFRTLLRQGKSDEELFAFLGKIWTDRQDRYSELRTINTSDIRKVEMSHIGG